MSRLVGYFVLGLCASASHAAGPDYTLLGIEAGESSFRVVFDRFGAGRMVSNGGDGANFKRHVCYRGEDGTTVVLSSWAWGDQVDEFQIAASVDVAEFGAADRGFRVSPKFNPKCTRSALASRDLQVGKMRLGMTLEDVLGLLGAPRRHVGTSLEYLEGDLRIGLRFDKDILVRIGVARWWE
jgi:hypothetical protein